MSQSTTFDLFAIALDTSDLPPLPSISTNDMIFADGFSLSSFPISPDAVTLPDIVNNLTPVDAPRKKPRFDHVIDLTMDFETEEEEEEEAEEEDYGIGYEETLVETEVDDNVSIQSTLADNGKTSLRKEKCTDYCCEWKNN